MTEGLDEILREIIHVHVAEEDVKISRYYEQKFIYKN